MTDASHKPRPYTREHGYNSARSAWDDERVAVLRDLHGKGWSAGQIAKRLSGVSRNAVIGKIHRLGLLGRTPGDHRALRPKKCRLPGKRGQIVWGKPKSLVPLPTEPLPPPNVSDIPRVSTQDLEDHHCRFVCLSEASGPFVKQFCGEPKIPGLPYCTVHAQRCYGSGSVLFKEIPTGGVGKLIDNELSRLGAVSEFLQDA